MAWWDKYTLPDSPPALDQHINLSTEESVTAQQLVKELSDRLENLPVILSQHGTVYAAAGCSPAAAADVALAIHLVWHQQAQRNAREVIRFPTTSNSGGAQAVPLVSLHVFGGLTLTVVWRGGQSLNRIRNQTAETQMKLQEWLSSLAPESH